MSFSADVKEELIKRYDKPVSMRRAELSAVLLLAPKLVSFDGERGIYIADFTSDLKTFNINGKLPLDKPIEEFVRKTEDKRAFLRGAFLAAGTLTDPGKDYRFEIITSRPEDGQLIASLMKDFGAGPGTALRRGKQVVYLKVSEDISLMLNVIGATSALMRFENARIEHEINASVNRRLNCDSANIKKTVSASMRQIEDIELIMESGAYEALSDVLKEICEARLANPDASLEELGELLPVKVGKSGVNHRLRKIAGIAAKIRGGR